MACSIEVAIAAAAAAAVGIKGVKVIELDISSWYFLQTVQLIQVPHSDQLDLRLTLIFSQLSSTPPPPTPTAATATTVTTTVNSRKHLPTTNQYNWSMNLIGVRLAGALVALVLCFCPGISLQV